MTLDNFIEKHLPKQVFDKIKVDNGNIPEDEYVENSLKSIWHNHFTGESSKLDEEFSFIYTVRLARSQKINGFIKLFLLKMPHQHEYVENYISTAILITSTGIIKFFGFKELEEGIIPLTYLNNNQKYLLYEIEQDLSFRNWGALINTRNLNEITQSILLAAGI